MYFKVPVEILYSINIPLHMPLILQYTAIVVSMRQNWTVLFEFTSCIFVHCSHWKLYYRVNRIGNINVMLPSDFLLVSVLWKRNFIKCTKSIKLLKEDIFLTIFLNNEWTFVIFYPV